MDRRTDELLIMYYLITPFFHLGTDTCSIVPSCWEDLIIIITSTNSRQQGDTCRLGLQLVQESAQYLVTHYNQKRLFTKVPNYTYFIITLHTIHVHLGNII